MRILKHILVTLVSAAVTVAAVFGGYTIYADGPYSFEDPLLGYYTLELEYHASMNAYFNYKVEKLVEMMDDKDFLDEISDPNTEAFRLFNAPASAEDCTDDNVSTFCVSMGAADRYVKYLETLSRVSGFLERDPGDTTAELILQKTNARDQEIAEEIENARKVMEGTVAVYNEFRLAYPMHKQYEQVILQLNKYKNKFRDIRRGVREFPLKFVDATSSFCE